MDGANTHPMEWLRLTTRWGDDFDNPTQGQLWEALRELDDVEEDQEGIPAWEMETALAWRDGTHIWFVAVFTDGSVVFGEAESGVEYVLTHPITHEYAMHLWRLLRGHQLTQLWREDWQPRTYPSE